MTMLRCAVFMISIAIAGDSVVRAVRAADPAPLHRPALVAKRGRGRVAVHVNPDMFVERGLRLPDGRIVPADKVISAERMEEVGATVVNSHDARAVLDGHFFYSGEIPHASAFEKGRPDHLCRPAGGDWQPDPLLMDERMMVVHVKDLGFVVFSACSHAGIVAGVARGRWR
jgi:7,8-dihydropterin-6-yl-methyl-4-(beta-D-ribofuranosyl)aminobenzene 5'-phosphate synthase